MEEHRTTRRFQSLSMTASQYFSFPLSISISKFHLCIRQIRSIRG